MVARNFFEESPNILFPRVDMGGGDPGIAGMEFPLLNYLHYLLASAFGWEHWYGRAINLLLSTTGSYCFYKIVRELFDRRVAFNATLVLLASIWFTYSRKIMPDVFACSLVLIAFYHGLRYLQERKKHWHLLPYAILGTFGVLSKIPAGFLFLPFGLLLLDRTYPLRRRRVIAGVSLLMILPVVLWYFHWVPFLNETYGSWSFPMSRTLGQGGEELLTHWPKAFKHFYSSAIKFIAFFCFLGGVLLAILRNERKLWILLLLTGPFFGLFMVKAGVQFVKHDYYVLPFVPIMALLAGYAIKQARLHWLSWLLLTGILVEGVLNRWHSIHLDEKHKELIHLEEDLDKVSEREDRIMVNSGRHPTPLYFAHREGWLVENSEVRDKGFLKKKYDEGCTYLLVLKRSFADPVDPPFGKKVLDKASYSIYHLGQESDGQGGKPS